MSVTAYYGNGKYWDILGHAHGYELDANSINCKAFEYEL